MKLTSRLSLPVHGAIEFLDGLVTMLAPVALSFGALAFVASATLGATLVGAALTLTSASGSGADRVVGVAAHSHFDSMFVVAVAIAALGFAMAGQFSAVILLAAVVLVQASLNFTTRHVATD